MYTLIENARIFTPVSRPEGRRFWQTRTMPDGALLINGEKIVDAGSGAEMVRLLPEGAPCRTVDAAGRLLTPGFVDCHTHPVFDNLRSDEFVRRIQGATYEEIARAGGGIRSSVRHLRAADEAQLFARLLPRLDRFLEMGTTTLEAKSGYGLTVQDELKSLRVIRQANAAHAVDLVPTFLGAHEIPDEYRDRRQDYIALVTESMLPAVAAENLAAFVDVFCENHVFTEDEARRILLAGRAAGLKPKIHADQLHNSGGARVAAEVGAISADHLEHTPEALDAALRAARVVPVMLPGADFFLRSSRYGPARRMIEHGLPVALATDFNPGSCMSESMPMMLTLSCLALRLTPAEAFVAATLHAAMALGRQNEVGSLEAGKLADFVLWDAEDISEIPYHFGVNLVERVHKRGTLVFKQRNTNLEKYA